ncbi:MAG: urea carboxylase-associated family protein, partial [Terriglobia bacterium]
MIEIPSRRGKAARLARGQIVKIVNTTGQQVVDTWAFNRADLNEFMSMEHTRPHLLKVIPAPGDAMLTNRRRPILTFLEDNSGGIHDMLMAACDRYR